MARVTLMGVGAWFKDILQARAASIPQWLVQMSKSSFADLNTAQQVAQYKSWVYNCVHRIQTQVASTPLRLYATRGAGEQKARRPARAVDYAAAQRLKSLNMPPRIKRRVDAAEDVEEILAHPFIDLMESINAFDNQFDHMELTQGMLDLTGSAYWYVERNMLGVPFQMMVLRSQWVVPQIDSSGRVVAYRYGVDPNRMVTFPAQEVIHFRYPSPYSVTEGFSPLAAAAMAVQRNTAMDIYEKSMNENMGMPAATVNYKTGRLDDKQRRTLSREWSNLFDGVKNAGKVWVTDMDYEVKPLSFAPREMAFLQGRSWTRQEIFNAFDVPVGLAETKDVNRSNMDSQLYMFLAFCITPRLRKLEQKMNERLIGMYDEPRLFCAFDEVVQGDKEFDLKQQDSDLDHAVRTINEVRTARKLPPVPWGDVPMKELAPAIGEPAEAEGEETDDTEKRLAMKAYALDTAEKKIFSTMRSFLSGLYDEVLSEFVKGEKSMRTKLKADDLFNVPKAIDVLGRIIIPSALPSVRAGIKSGRDKIGLGAVSRVSAEREARVMKLYGAKFAESVSKTIAKQLRTSVAKGIEDGDSISEIKSVIHDLFKGDRSMANCERIARTESANAFVRGEIAAWKESGVVTQKEWDASGDACEFCAEMHGKIIGLDAEFFGLGSTMTVNGRKLDFDYQEIAGPPLHPHCVLGDSRMFALGVQAMHRALYSGQVLELALADGARLSVTPNHALLTSRGFMQAGALRKGDNVIYCGAADRVISRYPNNDDVPFRIEEIFNAARMASGVTPVSVPVSPEYLHGDAARVDGDIDIVTTDGFLQGDVETSANERLTKLLFAWRYSDALAFSRERDLAAMLLRLRRAPDGVVSGGGQARALSLAGVRHADGHRLASPALDHSLLVKPVDDGAARRAEDFSKALHRYAGTVTAQQIVDINVRAFTGHVYDLSTQSGMYIANGVLSSNCRCDVLPVLGVVT